MTITVGTLPEGSRGFDCNERVTKQVAAAFVDKGFKFVVRYVPRRTHHDGDLTAIELLDLLNSGLAVMIVQHVAVEGWTPTLQLGTDYGATAAREARAAGYPTGAIIWLDLEGVSTAASAKQVIEYCNAWHDQVRGALYDAGLYVGWQAGLTAEQLYYKLKFRRYWSGYNLNKDRFPAVRGVCMKQGEYPAPHDRVPGVSFQYDINEVRRDHFNNLPTALLPGDPG